MKRWGLTLLLSFAILPAAAGDFELEKSFAGDELWILDALRSIPAQKEAWLKDAGEAAKTDADRERYVKRWRKRIAEFAQSHKDYLESNDINPNAPTVQQMVSTYEYNVTAFWLARQTPAKQEEVKATLAKGNKWIGVFPGKVAEGIRAARRESAADMAKYLASPVVKDAIAYQEPAEKPKDTALDQAKDIAAKDKKTAGGTQETAKDDSGKGYTGGGDRPVVIVPGDSSWQDYQPSLTLTKPDASAKPKFDIGGPPTPLIDRDEKPYGRTTWTLVKDIGLPVAGAAIAGVLFGLLLGPVGAVLGAILGAGIGHVVSKTFD